MSKLSLPTVGQEVIRIFTTQLDPKLKRLFGKGFLNKRRRPITRVRVTVPHVIMSATEQIKLEKLLRKRIYSIAREAKQKVSITIIPRRNIVTITVTVADTAPSSPSIAANPAPD